MRPGHVVLAVLTTHAWLKVMQPLLDAIEERRRVASPNSKRRRGQQSQWTALEFEMIERLRRVLGLRSCKETLAWFSSPQARLTRRILGLDRPRLVKGGRSLALDLVGLRGWRRSGHSS
jgi:hypothetical protein